MKTNKFKYLLGAITTLCMVFILMPTTALADGPEVYDGDIYVYDNKYTIVGDSDENGSGEYSISKENPIRGTGEPINRNIYIYDDYTELYFDNLDLGTGGIYTLDNFWESPRINIIDGTLYANEMYSHSSIALSPSTSIYIKEDVIGARITCDASQIDIGGDIIARVIGFFGRTGQPDIKVGGSVKCHRFSSEGSVQIDGDLTVSYFDTDYLKIRQIPTQTNSDNSVWIEPDEGENPIMFYVGGEISADDNIEISNSTAFVNSMNSKNGHIKVDDNSTLFNAVNKNPDVIPSNFSEPALNLHRTTLSGLIPNREANIVISYDDHDDYTKEFIATANAEGQVFVWLVGNKNLSGTAIYDGDEPITLTAEASASSGVVENLEFPYEPDNDTPTSESNESSSSTDGDSNVSTSDTETKKDDSDNTPKTTDSVKTIKADIPKTNDKSLMGLWVILSVTVSLTIAGTLIEKKNIKRQES